MCWDRKLETVSDESDNYHVVLLLPAKSICMKNCRKDPFVNRIRIIQQYDNTRSHVAKVTLEKLKELK